MVQQQAIADGVWDVLMVGLNVMSPAAINVLLVARASDIGIVVMCAVRSVLVDPELVTVRLREWQAEGLLAADTLDPAAGLSWILDGLANLCVMVSDTPEDSPCASSRSNKAPTASAPASLMTTVAQRVRAASSRSRVRSSSSPTSS